MEKRKKFGFSEWTQGENNINICKGCPNDCIYCYGKMLAYQRNQVKEGHWHKIEIQQDKVNKKRKLYTGLVGFPTTHDITPANIDAYLTVLDKLLLVDNDVLIVSKPRLDCIKRICEASQSYKDKITFRFTAGSIDDKILSFWEPNAPAYEERKASLKYAFEDGFQTSVSMEPLLDAPNIEALIKDVQPYVSGDIWIGLMNHINQIKKRASEPILNELKRIEAYDTTGMLMALYNVAQRYPKIKFKRETLKGINVARGISNRDDMINELFNAS